MNTQADSAKSNKNVTISVITATFNAENHLPRLIESLRAQSDKNFEWVVADGASTDSTVSLLQSAVDLNIVISSMPDFGIYDALNRALKLSTGDYYVVIGADDHFYPDAIEKYRDAIMESGADIVTAQAASGEAVLQVKGDKAWLYGSKAFISAHSVGAMFKKDLHSRYGYYSSSFPILADDYFMQKVCRAGASLHVVKFLAGEFTGGGVSNTDVAGTLLEAFRIQLIFENNKALQIILFLLRLIKNYKYL